MGTGGIGLRHLQQINRLEGVRGIAVPKRRSRIPILEEQGYPAVESLEEAVALGATHAVVATETGQHLPDGLSALKRGLHLLIEKPLAQDAQQGIRLGQQAKENRRDLFVGCLLRFSESLDRFRELLPELGPLHSVNAECRSYLPDWRPDRPYRDSYSARAGEGGVLLDLIHEIDYVGWIFGWPLAVRAKVKNLGVLGIASEELAWLNWESEKGFQATVELDYLTRPSRRRLSAFGRQGTLEWDALTGTITLARAGSEARRFSSGQTLDQMLGAQAKAFLQAGSEKPDARLATAEEGVWALAVCDAAHRASSTGNQEKVEAERGALV